MKVYYFLYSVFYFIKLAFKKKHYSIIFYAPNHFNRGKNSENIFFKDLFVSCKMHNLSFLYLEEPDVYSNQKRSEIAIPFDFIYYLIVFFRKFKKSEISYINNDKKIGGFVKKIFFKNITFDNYITISQSMLSFFSGVSSDAKLFDLQHGIIHLDRDTYVKDGVPVANISRNNVNLLLYGEGFKNLLTALKNGYDHTDIFVIGAYNKVLNITLESNKNILVSLQFTSDHTPKQNKLLSNELEHMIIDNPTFSFYLKNHPRFNKEVDLNRFYKFENAQKANSDLYSNFQKCSLHLTAYSTTTFECALLGVPTVFMQCLSDDFSAFKKDYDYPFNYSLSVVFNDYIDCSSKVNNWAKAYYTDFNEDKFINCLAS